MTNPYQSSEVPSGKSNKELEEFLWVRCVMAGAATWGVLFLAVQSLVGARLINFQSGIVGAVVCSMVFPLVPIYAALDLREHPIYLVLAGISGVLLHATFWIVLQARRRRRSG
jgi:hypothetical protein